MWYGYICVEKHTLSHCSKQKPEDNIGLCLTHFVPFPKRWRCFEIYRLCWIRRNWFCPERKNMPIEPGDDQCTIKPPSLLYSDCELKLKLISPTRPIVFFFSTLPLNVRDLSFKHPKVLCRYFWTSDSVGLMPGQGQYCTLAKSPSCERLSESYRKSFCLHC